MDATTAALALACPVRPPNDPAANPYRIEFAIVLGVLVTVFIVWRRVRPARISFLRHCAATSGVVAFAVMHTQACIYFERADRNSGLRVVLEASVLVAASLLAELLIASRRRPTIARAVAVRRASSEPVGPQGNADGSPREVAPRRR